MASPVRESVSASCRLASSSRAFSEAQRRASQDEHDRDGRKQQRDRVHVNLRCRDEHARRNQSAHNGRTEHGSILELDPRDAPGPLPGGQSNEDDRERPGEVDVRALDVRAHRNLVEVDGVAHDIEQEPGCDQSPGAPGAPARDRKDEDDEGEPEHVADRIRDVRQHDEPAAVRGVDYYLDEHRGAERGCGRRGDEPVEP